MPIVKFGNPTSHKTSEDNGCFLSDQILTCA